jgi:hypothetical protein
MGARRRGWASWGLAAAGIVGCTRAPIGLAPPAAPPVAPAAPVEAPVPLAVSEDVLDLRVATVLAFSADRAHVLARSRDERGERLLLDGREIACCVPSFHDTALAADGTWVSWMARAPDTDEIRTLVSHGGRATVLDGEPAELAVTPDGAHLATAVSFSLRDDSAIERDGVPVGSGFEPRLLTLSPDGSRWAVSTQVDRYGGGDTVTVDGKQGPRHASVWGLRFSPDGAHVAYVGRGEGSSPTALVLDGRARTFAQVDDDLAFTADGRLVARVFHDGAWHLRIGDREWPCGSRIERIVGDEHVWWVDEGPEGDHHVARAVVDGVEWFRVDLGVRDPEHGDYGPAIAGLTVAPDGARFAFTTGDGVYLGAEGAARRVGPAARPLAFDPSGDRLAVFARTPTEGRVEVWSLEGERPPVSGPRLVPADRILEHTVRWDGDRVSYFAERGDTLVRESFPAP